MPNNLWRENLISSEIALNWEQLKAIFFHLVHGYVSRGAPMARKSEAHNKISN